MKEKTWWLEFIEYNKPVKLQPGRTVTGYLPPMVHCTEKKSVTSIYFYRKTDALKYWREKLGDDVPFRLFQRVLRGYEYRWPLRETSGQEPFFVKYPYEKH